MYEDFEGYKLRLIFKNLFLYDLLCRFGKTGNFVFDFGILQLETSAINIRIPYIYYILYYAFKSQHLNLFACSKKKKKKKQA